MSLSDYYRAAEDSVSFAHTQTEAGEHAGSIVLTPAAVIPRDQEWFWTPQWQAREAEANADLAAGRYPRFDDDEDFLAALDDLG